MKNEGDQAMESLRKEENVSGAGFWEKRGWEGSGHGWSWPWRPLTLITEVHVRNYHLPRYAEQTQIDQRPSCLPVGRQRREPTVR
jgi:hypothetical protein